MRRANNEEEAVQRRVDYRGAEGIGSGAGRQGVDEEARYRGGDILPVAIQVWRNGVERGEATEAPGGRKPATEEARGGSGFGHSDPQGRKLKKLVKPTARRNAITYARDSYKVSLRKDCGLMNMHKSSFYYRAVPANDGPLRAALKEQAYTYRRWGCETLIDILRRDGWMDNHKRIERIYREEGLQVKRRRKRRTARWRGEPLEQPSGLNELWAMDFVSDQLAGGRRLRLLVVMDVHSRECLAIEADSSLTGSRVVRVLCRLAQQRGLPQRILTDNGPEFIGRAMDRWAFEHEVKLHFIEPGKPMQNGFVEGFNSTLRDQCLNEHWFMGLADAREIIEKWRRLYNEVKPHSSLNRMTPEEFAGSCPGHAPDTNQQAETNRVEMAGSLT